MNEKDMPAHFHHFEGGMRESLDELLVKYKSEIDTLRQKVTDVFPQDEPDFYDDLFIMRFVMTHSKGGKECNYKDAEDALRKTIAWRKQHADLLKRTFETGKAPNEDICMKFNTVGYAGDLGGLEPIFVVRTGHCNTKGLMNTMTEDQVRDWLHFSREIAFRICDQRTRETRTMIKNITIIDLAGWSMFAGDSRFEKCLQKASELSAIYYPQLLVLYLLHSPPSCSLPSLRLSTPTSILFSNEKCNFNYATPMSTNTREAKVKLLATSLPFLHVPHTRTSIPCTGSHMALRVHTYLTPVYQGKTVILNMPSFFKSIFKASMSLMPASLKDKIAICPQADVQNCGKDVTAVRVGWGVPVPVSDALVVVSVVPVAAAEGVVVVVAYPPAF